ncbi:bifunctional adenosylcobinamide kinase/adenosylcobinamide-phosphate guanylyltransferase [Clostridium sp. OM08-29]|jgi:adenosylcobinamide kinase/adenosylcobinamide-phosphate guanylyltransferase|nr:bifunctional adenosylcobinamide kinase/adenosylcobinamide-phosphate guanylyltransferase [Clostridium sp. AF43-10]RHU82451.1 bifunctional adenosylcobinamide kinase/adenosylcobinamide-phosphate guanylyltransferase [Clostridium sp. OM08-29]
MLHIVYGGSASGKSSYAESFAMSLQGEGRLLYIATMYPYKWNTTEIDPETMQRIERHRAMRADKGFDTVECYRHVEHIVAKRQDVLLLECMSNLLANEMYLEPDSNAGSDMAETMSPVSNKIVQALIDLSTRVQELVIVTNDVFSDGGSLTYDESTREYVKNLAEINCALARVAETVTEVVCGIPVIVKKNHPMGK